MAWSDPSNFTNPHGSVLDLVEGVSELFTENIINLNPGPVRQDRGSFLDEICIAFIVFVVVAMFSLLCVLRIL